jgi:hypothetical protein
MNHVLRLAALATSFAAPLLRAEVLVNPIITASAPAFSGGFSVDRIFDGEKTSEYASQGQGANTFIEFDFGAPVTMDAFALVNRNSPVDVVDSYDLIFSNSPDFSSPTVLSISGAITGRMNGPIQSFAPQTARYVRWNVTSASDGNNQGAFEIRFLNHYNDRIQGVSVLATAPAFSEQYPASGLLNGNVGSSDFVAGNEYASASQGTDTFMDFDLGSKRPIRGFDFFQRLALVDRPTSYDVIFSNDPTFTTNLAKRSYDGTQASWVLSDSFGEINARYVRFDVTGGSSNGAYGGEEVIFYTVPEPGTASLLNYHPGSRASSQSRPRSGLNPDPTALTRPHRSNP